MTKHLIGSACSGIGGLELGLERAGLGRVAWQIELDPFCREVLEQHWPGVLRYEDVRACSPPEVDVLCAGFPCQPVSVAGKRLAQKDERWLWPEITRLIDVCAPGIIVIENVPGLRTAGLRDVLADLAARGFDAEWTHFKASAIGAPHWRDRIWLVVTHPKRVRVREQPGWLGRACRAAFAPVPGGILADAEGDGRKRGGGRPESLFYKGQIEKGRLKSEGGLLHAPDPDRARRLQRAIGVAEQRGWAQHCGWRLDPVAGMDDGLPGRLGAARKALGNSAVVPCAELVGRAIVQTVAQ